MTVLLYRLDPYIKEFDAAVTGVGDGYIVLDRTCFHPLGGGQAGDTGSIDGTKVTNTLKEGEEVRHLVEDSSVVVQGQVVHCAIDWDRRYRIMRLHSASHLVYYAMQEIFGPSCKPASSGMLDDAKDRSDYLFDVPLDRGKLAMVEARVNRLVSDSLPITHGIETGSEDRLIWRATSFPPMECGGTHIHNTSEIGQVHLRRGSKPGRGRERVELTLA